MTHSRPLLAVLCALTLGGAVGAACTKTPKFCGVRATVSLAGSEVPPQQLQKVASVLEQRLPNIERLAVDKIEVAEGGLSIRVARQPDESLDALEKRLTTAVEGFHPSELAFHLVIQDAAARAPVADALQKAFGERVSIAQGDTPHVATVRDTPRDEIRTALRAVPLQAGQSVILEKSPGGAWDVLLVEAQGPLRARSIHAAQVAMNTANQPVVTVTFDPKGAKLLEMVTRRAEGKFLAILVDGEAMSVPRVQSPISSGKIQITLGSGPSKEALFREAQGLAASLQLASVQSARPIRLEVKEVEPECEGKS